MVAVPGWSLTAMLLIVSTIEFWPSTPPLFGVIVIAPPLALADQPALTCGPKSAAAVRSLAAVPIGSSKAIDVTVTGFRCGLDITTVNVPLALACNGSGEARNA